MVTPCLLCVRQQKTLMLGVEVKNKRLQLLIHTQTFQSFVIQIQSHSCSLAVSRSHVNATAGHDQCSSSPQLDVPVDLNAAELLLFPDQSNHRQTELHPLPVV